MAKESIKSNPFYINDSNTKVGNRILASHLEWSNGRTYWDAAWDENGTNRVDGILGDVSSAMHHYMYMYDGDNGIMSVYKDNVRVLHSSNRPGGAINWGAVKNFELGAFSFNNGNWAGEMDDFAIWDEILNEKYRTQAFTTGASSVPSSSGTALFLGMGLLGIGLFRRPKAN